MNIRVCQAFISSFYKRRNWYQYTPFIRMNFLAEEIGEVSRAVRALEIGRDRPDEALASEDVRRENLVESWRRSGQFVDTGRQIRGVFGGSPGSAPGKASVALSINLKFVWRNAMGQCSVFKIKAFSLAPDPAFF